MLCQRQLKVSRHASTFKASNPEFAKPNAPVLDTQTTALSEQLKSQAYAAYELSKSMHLKEVRRKYVSQKHAEIVAEHASEELTESDIENALSSLRKQWVREYMLDTQTRVDGRDFNTVRPIRVTRGLH